MKAFTQHTGLVAAMDRSNVDTDQIIPKQFLKRIERSGFGKFLFFDWRCEPDGTPKPEFVLNQSQYRDASMLIAGKNFGCGSSREHAPWALADYGFRAIIAPSFADIFDSNCAKNGILLCAIEEDTVRELMRRAQEANGYRLSVDLEICEVRDDFGLHASFKVDAFRRECLLNGWDDISLTLRHEDAILVYERLHRRVQKTA